MRKNKDKIYLVKAGKEYEVESQIITKGVRSYYYSNKPTGAVYIEHHGYFVGLYRVLDSLTKFCETIATKPIAITM